jgi:hypothetical protein
MEMMLKRRSRVRELIEQFRESNREPFPNWGVVKSVGMTRSFVASTGPGEFVM